MRFTYENEGAVTFLVCELDEQDVLDELSMGMLQNNQFKGILPVAFVQMDDRRFLKWNISSKVDMESYLGGKIGRQKLLNIFLSICETFACTEEYFLDNDQFLLERKYMYCMVSTGATSLVYLPVVREGQEVKLKDVIKDILYNVDFLESEDSSYVAILMNHLRRPDDMSPQELYDFITGLRDQPGVGNRSSERQSAGERVRAQSNISPGDNAYKQIPPHNVRTNQQYVNPQYSRQQYGNTMSNIHSYPNRTTDGSRTVSQGVPMNNPPVNPYQMPPMNYHNTNAMQRGSGSPVEAYQPGGIQKRQPEAMNQEDATSKKALFGFGKKKKTEDRNKTEKKGGLFGGRNKAEGKSTADVPQSYGGIKIPGQNQGDREIRTEYIPGKGQVQQNVNISTPVGMNQVTYAQQSPGQMGMYGQNMYQNETGNSTDYAAPGTTILTPSMVGADTSILAANPNAVSEQHIYIPTATLRRLKNNQVKQINKDVFHIGREVTYADFVIGDNGAISNSHADIICRDKKYYLKDTNSLNHTYLNGEMLTSNEEYELRSGDFILLANEEFEFRVK